MNTWEADLSAQRINIAIIGLGYVGLPLAIEFAKKFNVTGFDVNEARVAELKRGFDRTNEADSNALLTVMQNETDTATPSGLSFSASLTDISSCTVFIITVPTPVDQFKCPDLNPLLNASKMLAQVLKRGDVVIYESTVYPGCTEEECIPVLEQASGFVLNDDFYVGYSPERINPGDKVNTLTRIRKVTSGSTPAAAAFVDKLYASIITAGTYMAPSIKVAEASKAIENAQRDLNISFVNELALIFDRIGIDTNDVIEAAGTKWNFLKFKPGLVGGHCIGVDPYYLVHKAQSLGYHPQVILSGRRVNDMMGQFVANKVVKLMIANDIKIKGAAVLILGITFKEDCPDIRNTRVVDIYHELSQFGLRVDVFDPHADSDEVKKEHGIDIVKHVEPHAAYQAIIVAVAHRAFMDLDYSGLKSPGGIIFDTKAFLDRSMVDGRL